MMFLLDNLSKPKEVTCGVFCTIEYIGANKWLHSMDGHLNAELFIAPRQSSSVHWINSLDVCFCTWIGARAPGLPWATKNNPLLLSTHTVGNADGVACSAWPCLRRDDQSANIIPHFAHSCFTDLPLLLCLNSCPTEWSKLKSWFVDFNVKDNTLRDYPVIKCMGC